MRAKIFSAKSLNRFFRQTPKRATVLQSSVIQKWSVLHHRPLPPASQANRCGRYDPGAYTPGRGPQPSISAGVRNFTLSPALQAGTPRFPLLLSVLFTIDDLIFMR